MNREKILNIKIDEEDYERIIVSLASSAQQLNKNKDNITDLEELDKINFEIYQYKLLMCKLRTCKLYNED